jgi:hypothetical protein
MKTLTARRFEPIRIEMLNELKQITTSCFNLSNEAHKLDQFDRINSSNFFNFIDRIRIQRNNIIAELDKIMEIDLGD